MYDYNTLYTPQILLRGVYEGQLIPGVMTWDFGWLCTHGSSSKGQILIYVVFMVPFG